MTQGNAHKTTAWLISGLLACFNLYAANPQTILAEVEFAAPISITKINTLQFGLLSTDMVANNTVNIATDSSVSDSNNRIISGTQAGADLTITATTSQALTITVNSIVNGNGYMLGTFLCDYNTGAAVGGCDGSGLSVATSAASASLRIGATLTGTGADVIGVANGSFDITVSYQ